MYGPVPPITFAVISSVCPTSIVEFGIVRLGAPNDSALLTVTVPSAFALLPAESVTSTDILFVPAYVPVNVIVFVVPDSVLPLSVQR